MPTDASKGEVLINTRGGKDYKSREDLKMHK